MIYVDTSVLVALFLNEAKSTDVIHWYNHCTSEIISATWCVTEFASALRLKQRTKQITAEQSHIAWQKFERLYAHDLQLLVVEPKIFHQASALILGNLSGLRAGDALHLATALAANVKKIATLDRLLAKQAQSLKLTLVFLIFFIVGMTKNIYPSHLKMRTSQFVIPRQRPRNPGFFVDPAVKPRDDDSK